MRHTQFTQRLSWMFLPKGARKSGGTTPACITKITTQAAPTGQKIDQMSRAMPASKI
jgi:hypothetical protein